MKSKTTSSAVKPVKKRSKVSTLSSKPVKKRSAAVKALSVKAVKKRSVSSAKVSKAVKPASDELKPTVVPLAEVTLLAAKAVKMIVAKKSLPAAKKARKLVSVAETLERASGWGGLSACGAWGLANPFGLNIVVNDWKAVLR